MKKILTVIIPVFILMLGVNTVGAQTLTQDQNRPEVIAKAKAVDLKETLNLNGDQQRAVFRALVANEVNYKKNILGKDQTNTAVIANKQKNDKVLNAAMKKTLTSEQYKKWLSLQN
jgi:hypothetical protein